MNNQNAMINEDSKKTLKNIAGIECAVDFELNRTSKYVIEVSLVDGMCLLAKFKINAKTGACTQTI